jgi:hypothetical protein
LWLRSNTLSFCKRRIFISNLFCSTWLIWNRNKNKSVMSMKIILSPKTWYCPFWHFRNSTSELRSLCDVYSLKHRCVYILTSLMGSLSLSSATVTLQENKCSHIRVDASQQWLRFFNDWRFEQVLQ